MTREHTAYPRREWSGDSNEDVVEADDVNSGVRISASRYRKWPRKEIVLSDHSSSSMFEELMPINVIVDEDNDQGIDNEFN
jgi:hypothetical protein